MEECVARVTSKGQVTIPLAIRKQIQAKKGDYLVFRVKNEKIEIEKVVISPQDRFEKLTSGVEERFKRLGISPKDLEEGLRWAQE
jgi:antitoxin PrlF